MLAKSLLLSLKSSRGLPSLSKSFVSRSTVVRAGNNTHHDGHNSHHDAHDDHGHDDHAPHPMWEPGPFPIGPSFLFTFGSLFVGVGLILFAVNFQQKKHGFYPSSS